MMRLICLFLIVTSGLVLARDEEKKAAPSSGSELTSKAADVMDKAAKASMSDDVAKSFESMITLGSMTVPPGIEGKMAIYTKPGGKIFSQINIQAQGLNMEIVQGCDGENCYSKDPTIGLRMLEGQEKEMMLFQNDLTGAVNWRDFYAKYEYKGEGEVSGKKVHKVYLETADGATMTNFYDAESYRLLKSEGNYAGPMGQFVYASDFLDYQEVTKGLVVPMRIETAMMGMSMTMKIDEVEFNVPIPDSKFKLPAGLAGK